MVYDELMIFFGNTIKFMFDQVLLKKDITLNYFLKVCKEFQSIKCFPGDYESKYWETKIAYIQKSFIKEYMDRIKMCVPDDASM